MTEKDMKARTKAFALRVLRLTDSLPRSRATDVLGRQLLRSATSVGANYRAACRAKSSADFLSKLAIVEEECDESEYWLELLGDAKIVRPELLKDLRTEAHELTAITVSSIKTARRRSSAARRTTQSKIQNPKSKIRKGG